MAATQEHLAHVHREMTSWKKRAGAAKAKLTKATGHIVRTLEVGTGAFVGGLLVGKLGSDDKTKDKSHVAGVPLDLGIALGLNLLGYFEVGGENSHHLNAFGDGFLGAYMSGVGFAKGKQWEATGKLFGASSTSALPTSATTTSGYDPATLARIMASVPPPGPIPSGPMG